MAKIKLFKAGEKILVKRGKYRGIYGLVKNYGSTNRINIYSEKGAFWTTENCCSSCLEEPNDEYFMMVCLANSLSLVGLPSNDAF